jgi:hypothetical protein
MKIRIALLLMLGVAGLGASLALADDGHGDHAATVNCQHTRISGKTAAPQSFTVTVTHAEDHGTLTTGQVVTVVLGASGQTIRFHGTGCVGTNSTLTIRSAALHAEQTDQSTTTTGSTTATTTDTTTEGRHHHH